MTKRRPTEGKPAVIPRPGKPVTHTPPPPKPLAERLQIGAGMDVLIARAPFPLDALLGALPEGARVRTLKRISPRSRADCVLLFVENKAAIDAHAARAITAVRPGGMLWIAYPKQSSAVTTDLDRDQGWETLDAAGWAAGRQVDIDDTWSALCFRPQAEIVRRGGPPR